MPNSQARSCEQPKERSLRQIRHQQKAAAAEGTPLDWGVCLIIAGAVALALRNAQAKRRAMSDVVLSLRQVSKRFGALTMLDQVNLDVARGEAVCVLGPSGSGKSTLLRCINHLERPDEGEVYLAGKPIGRGPGGLIAMSDRELSLMRTRVGMAFQQFALWPHMNVLRNLVERVGIARALMMKPEVVLFDEPTSALDPELVGEVLAVIRDLARDGLTMLVGTHEMAFAREVGSRIVFMDQGRVVETAEPAKFFIDPSTPRARQFIDRYAIDIAR